MAWASHPMCCSRAGETSPTPDRLLPTRWNPFNGRTVKRALTDSGRVTFIIDQTFRFETWAVGGLPALPVRRARPAHDEMHAVERRVRLRHVTALVGAPALAPLECRCGDQPCECE